MSCSAEPQSGFDSSNSCWEFPPNALFHLQPICSENCITPSPSLSFLNNLRNSKHLKVQLGAVAVQTEMAGKLCCKPFLDEYWKSRSSAVWCLRCQIQWWFSSVQRKRGGNELCLCHSFTNMQRARVKKMLHARLDTIRCREQCGKKKGRTWMCFCGFMMQEITIILTKLHLI